MGRIWVVTKEQNGHTSSAARNRAHWQHCAARNNLLKSTCCSRAVRENVHVRGIDIVTPLVMHRGRRN